MYIYKYLDDLKQFESLYVIIQMYFSVNLYIGSSNTIFTPFSSRGPGNHDHSTTVYDFRYNIMLILRWYIL